MSSLRLAVILLAVVWTQGSPTDKDSPLAQAYIPKADLEDGSGITDGKPNQPPLSAPGGDSAQRPAAAAATPDAARLPGGTAMEGRFEMQHYDSTTGSSVWGTVCDDLFDNIAATVACRMIGYRNGGMFLRNTYGAGTGTIWLDDVRCTGSEETLGDCSHLAYGSHNCGHYEDVSISCFQNNPDLGYQDSARLVNSSVALEGRLELFHNGVWGTVCDDGFDDTDAVVACRMAGYSGGTFLNNQYGTGTSTQQIWLDDLACTGNETGLQNCRSLGWGVHNCGHSEDVSVRCY